MNQNILNEILNKYQADQSFIISILQDLQEQCGYLPKDLLISLARELNIPLSRILSLATFYQAFYLEPKGRHPIHVCMGTACHVRGAQPVLEKFERELGIKSGDTTADQNFSLDEVRCVGCCGLAPVVMIGEEVHGKIKPSKVSSILKNYT